MAVARVNFSVIMQAVEDKLIADAVVSDVSLITWSVNDNVPQLSGPYDILIRARNASPISGFPTDGGAWDFRLSRHLDIYVRSQSVKDAGGGNKSWVVSHFALSDLILNSMLAETGYGTFWPEKNGEFLTTMPIKVFTDAPPERKSDGSVWGDSVCTLEVHYMPNITPQGL